MGVVALLVLLAAVSAAPCPDAPSRVLDDDDPFELGWDAPATHATPVPRSVDRDPFDVLGWDVVTPVAGCSQAPRAIDDTMPFPRSPFTEDATPAPVSVPVAPIDVDNPFGGAPAVPGPVKRPIDVTTPF
jgi:hypothetical protein